MPVAKDKTTFARRVQVPDAQRQAQRLTQFSKTKLCKFELLGMCTKGNTCQFAHGQTDLKPLPDLTKTKLCTLMMRTGHCNKDDCTFAHSREELRTPAQIQQMLLQYQQQQQQLHQQQQQALAAAKRSNRFDQSGGKGTNAARGHFSMMNEFLIPDISQQEDYVLPPGLEGLFGSAGEEDDAVSRTSTNSSPPSSSDSTAPGTVAAAGAAAPRHVVPFKDSLATGEAPAKVVAKGGAWSPHEPAYVPLPSKSSKDKLLADPWKILDAPKYAMPSTLATSSLKWMNTDSESTLSTVGDSPDSALGAETAASTSDGFSSPFAFPIPVTLPLPQAFIA